MNRRNLLKSAFGSLSLLCLPFLNKIGYSKEMSESDNIKRIRREFNAKVYYYDGTNEDYIDDQDKRINILIRTNDKSCPKYPCKVDYRNLGLCSWESYLNKFPTDTQILERLNCNPNREVIIMKNDNKYLLCNFRRDF